MLPAKYLLEATSPIIVRRRATATAGGADHGLFRRHEVGQRRDLGSFTFTAELIKTFASQFDPQPFHLDEEEGRNSLFGGLAASGWHVGSVCMKLLVAEVSVRRRKPLRAAKSRRCGDRRRDFAICAG